MTLINNLYRELGLSENEYRKIVKILGRQPNEVETGIFSALWSEHCSYKSSRRYIKELPREAPWVLVNSGENAGVVDVGNGYGCVFKMESHNHPSFIEPYQGAATGVGGIIRDIFTMGARPIALLDSLRFGNISKNRTRYLVHGVVSGIAGYGNCMGIPTVGGETFFDNSFEKNILVNAFCAGIVKTDALFSSKARGVGNSVIYLGSKTGRDGIHGASMASSEFDKDSELKRPTVQVGDPFSEKLLLEATLELGASGAIVAIQDMGAAGLTSSSFEMANKGECGMIIDLARVPVREELMTPFEIMLSESQERMLLVARKGKEKLIERIFSKWDLDAVVIGKIVEEESVIIQNKNEVVTILPTKPLVENAPIYERPIKKPCYLSEVKNISEDTLMEPHNLNNTLLELLGSLNICSKRWIYEQYDYQVGTNTIVSPGSDAAVIRIRETNKALAFTTDCNSRLVYLDPYWGSFMAVLEAGRNIVCSGAKPLAITDCLNFGNPEKREVMYQFEQSIKGMSDAAKYLGTPFVSGNVSFYNETEGESIYPTPTIGMVGMIDDMTKTTTQWFKEEGDIILLLGKNEGTIGGSEYLRLIHNITGGRIPMPDVEMELAVQNACRTAISQGLVKSAHDVSLGGLAVALSIAALSRPLKYGGPLGVNVALDKNIRSDFLLFSEEPGRIILSASKQNLNKILKICEEYSAPVDVIGSVTNGGFDIGGNINLPIDLMFNKWNNSFSELIRYR